MGRKKQNLESGNVTKDRLAGTPFSSKSEMDAASDELRKAIWTQLERVRIKKELLRKPELKSFLEPFQTGLGCKYSEKTDLFRIHLNEHGGVDVNIHEEMKTEENRAALLTAFIRSTSDSFLSNYLKSLDILPNSTNDDEEVVISDKKQAKKRK